MTTIFFIISIAILLAGRGLDIYSSLRFPYYGQKEGNSLNADKYGYFSLPKNILWTAAVAVPVIVLTLLFWDDLSPGGILALLVGGLGSAAHGLTNLRPQKENRKKQLSILRRLRDGEPIGWIGSINARGGRTRYLLFGWIYSEKTEIGEAVREIDERIFYLAKNTPESEWFPK